MDIEQIKKNLESLNADELNSLIGFINDRIGYLKSLQEFIDIIEDQSLKEKEKEKQDINKNKGKKKQN